MKHKSKNKKSTSTNTPKRHYATKLSKFKAFLIDNFMLLMPIMYVVFYLIMGSRADFAEHKLYGWIAIFVPLVIVQTIFFYKDGQTPGYKAYSLKLIDEGTGKIPNLGIIFFRNLCAILSFFSIFGWIMMFFRKDHKALHDLLSNTAVIQL
ncbi:MAG: RDD family protein [Sulfurovaceae bacterium]|nr:RDD family protein [Sulfurovaceae bacterium]